MNRYDIVFEDTLLIPDHSFDKWWHPPEKNYAVEELLDTPLNLVIMSERLDIIEDRLKVMGIFEEFIETNDLREWLLKN